MEAAARLFTAYADSLGIDLTFQSFAEELAGLPGKYAPPAGELLLAHSPDGRTYLGCVALRPRPDAKMRSASDGASGASGPPCELKRFYVSPGARGMGVGEALARAACRSAEDLGYTEAVIDTLPSMAAALRLYEKLGFVEIPPYYETPILGTRFFKKTLEYKLPEEASDACMESRRQPLM